MKEFCYIRVLRPKQPISLQERLVYSLLYWRKKWLSKQSIAKTLSISKNTLPKILANLEKAGLVERRQNPKRKSTVTAHCRYKALPPTTATFHQKKAKDAATEFAYLPCYLRRAGADLTLAETFLISCLPYFARKAHKYAFVQSVTGLSRATVFRAFATLQAYGFCKVRSVGCNLSIEITSPESLPDETKSNLSRWLRYRKGYQPVNTVMTTPKQPEPKPEQPAPQEPERREHPDVIAVREAWQGRTFEEICLAFNVPKAFFKQRIEPFLDGTNLPFLHDTIRSCNYYCKQHPPHCGHMGYLLASKIEAQAIKYRQYWSNQQFAPTRSPHDLLIAINQVINRDKSIMKDLVNIKSIPLGVSPYWYQLCPSIKELLKKQGKTWQDAAEEYRWPADNYIIPEEILGKAQQRFDELWAIYGKTEKLESAHATAR